MPTPYEIATAGGAHAGLLRQLPKLGGAQLNKSIQSLRKVAELHVEKVSNPVKFVPDWLARSPQYQQGLLAKWRVEIENAEQQIDVIKGYLDEQGK